MDQLPAACRAAKADFRPLTADDLQQAKAELAEAVARLDRRLHLAGANGAAWRKYLRWGQMQGQLRRGSELDLAVLDEVYKRYTAEHNGLELVWFVDVREALRRYRAIARNLDDPGLQARYEQLLEALAEHLQGYIARPTAEEALVIGGAVGQLEQARQAPALVRAIRHHLVRPNLRVEVSGALVAAGIARPVDQTQPVRDVILGTDIYGTGHTIGRTDVQLSPDAGRGAIDTVLSGIIETRNVGYRGPVRIYSNGTTRIDARKRLLIHATGLDSLPTASRAATRTRITGIRSRRGLRWVERIAWRRAAKQKRQAEYIASRHAEGRVNRRIDRQAAKTIGRANEVFVNKFRKPLLRRNLFPQQFRFATTRDAVRLVSLRADAGQLAAPGAPPETGRPCDLAICLHESMINNLAIRALAGTTIRQQGFEAAVIRWLGELPEPLRSDQDQSRWGVRFPRRGHPISVAFADGRFRVTVRAARYYRGDESHPGMDVTAVYKIARTERGFKAVRQGDLKIFPPGFKPGGGKKIPARYMAIRTLLQRRFGRIFKKQIVGEGFVLPGNWSKAGKLRPIELACQNGWLTAGWKATPAAPAVAGNP